MIYLTITSLVFSVVAVLWLCLQAQTIRFLKKDLLTLRDYSGQNRQELRSGMHQMSDIYRSQVLVTNGHRKEIDELSARFTALGLETPAGVKGPSLRVMTTQFADAIVRTMKVLAALEVAKRSKGHDGTGDNRPEDDLEALDSDGPGADVPGH